MSAYENWSDEDARDYLAAGLCDTHWHSCIPKPCDESQSKADQLIALAHSGPDLAAKDARIAELEQSLSAAMRNSEYADLKARDFEAQSHASESALAECREREARLREAAQPFAGGEWVRHDHAYPMEVGPHHCDGCDHHARLRAILDGGEGQ